MPDNPRTRALLLLDLVQATVRPTGRFAQTMDPATDFDGLCSRIRTALDDARRDGDAVVWVVPGAEFMKRMSGWIAQPEDLRPDPIVGEPGPDEPVVMKAEIGGFEGSDLDATLKKLGVEEIVLVGVATQYVVALTAREGAALGYRVRILADGCADIDAETHTRILAELRDVATVDTIEH